MRTKFLWIIASIAAILAVFFLYRNKQQAVVKPLAALPVTPTWSAPDINQLPAGPASELILYGHDLIANTAHYLGPTGTVAKISNGLNCQNCHLEAGTRLGGNSFAAVASSYPKFRKRSGQVESLAFRVNGCLERSMNGQKLDSNSREMQAFKAYLVWVSNKDPKINNESLSGTGPIAYLARCSDTVKGRMLFARKCAVCHGKDGSGMAKTDGAGYFYPPLWGEHSYNVSSGLYRLSMLAAFIKYNMPYTPKQVAPQLTDEESWDLAAFISSQKRPEKFFSYDWPVLDTKPDDYPFGPYADSFSEYQHKYGPFEPIVAAHKANKK